MKCPSCGEPILSRHTFCVICGADLSEQLSRPASDKRRGAKTKIQSLLTKPFAQKHAASPAAVAVRERNSAPAVSDFRRPVEDDLARIPAFLRKYV